MDNGYKIQAAVDMLDLFMENAHYHPDEGIHFLTPEGWDKVSGRFGIVYPEARGEVFTSFLKLLDDAGINYDIEQFAETEH